MAVARDIMTAQVVSVKTDDSVDAVAEVLLRVGHHSVPVVDGAGRVQGMISQEDLIDATRKVHLPTVITILDSFIPLGGYKEFADDLRKSTATTAQQLASVNLVYAEADEDVDSVAEKLSQSHVHALPVVDHDKRLLGIITRSDVLRALLSKTKP
ncbi:MAG: CBS domain-containing protein [Pseudomonadota bacterium]